MKQERKEKENKWRNENEKEKNKKKERMIKKWITNDNYVAGRRWKKIANEEKKEFSVNEK